MDVDGSALASFEGRWATVHPEFALALKFSGPADRCPQTAFCCLVFELEHVAFAIRDPEPAAIKLQWWAEEFSRVAQGKPRHPLTQALASTTRIAEIAPARWHEIVTAAFGRREREPAPDSAALLETYMRLYSPLSAVEAALCGVDARQRGMEMALARSLRETASLPILVRDGHLPLPLDLLARHRLSRGDLAVVSASRRHALRDWLREISTRFDDLGAIARTDTGDAIRGPSFDAWHAALVAVNAHRASRAARAVEPLAALNRSLQGISPVAAWKTWRAVRRSRH